MFGQEEERGGEVKVEEVRRKRIGKDKGKGEVEGETIEEEGKEYTGHTAMPLHPRYAVSHCFSGYTATRARAAHTVEVFLDFNCPYSAKMFRKLQDAIVPQLGPQGGDYSVYMVNVVQPWHGFQSSVLHEVSLAVARSTPEKYLNVARVLFDNISMFYDDCVQDLTKRELTQKVISLITGGGDESGLLTKDESKQVEQLLEIKPGSGNAGNGVGVDSKYFARYARTLGVHVTPSVLVNGIFVPQIESSSEPEEVIRILGQVTK